MKDKENDQTSRLLKPQEVGRLLGVSVKTLHRLVTDGRLPSPVQISKRGTRWKQADIDTYIDGLGSA